MSSRNVYLSPAERQAAPALYRALCGTGAALRNGSGGLAELLAHGLVALRTAGVHPQYLELRDAETLAPLASLDRPDRLLAAARLGRTRLIDNIAVMPR